jgi:hypothetical protein
LGGSDSSYTLRHRSVIDDYRPDALPLPAHHCPQSFQYREKLSVRQVARELGVHYVVEGVRVRATSATSRAPAVLSGRQHFGWSIAMGAGYFAGFFGYLGYRDRPLP